MNGEGGAQLTVALQVIVDHVADRVAANVAERLRPQLGELVAIHGAAPAPSEPAPRPGDLLTIAEVATLLNVPKATVSFWTYRSGVLPHVSIGAGRRKLCRIRRADLEALIESGPRGSAREQALALLAASERRSEVRQKRRTSQGAAGEAEPPSTPALKRGRPPTTVLDIRSRQRREQ